MVRCWLEDSLWKADEKLGHRRSMFGAISRRHSKWVLICLSENADRRYVGKARVMVSPLICSWQRAGLKLLMSATKSHSLMSAKKTHSLSQILVSKVQN